LLRALFNKDVMAGRNGQQMVGTYVPADLAGRFKAWARGTEGGASAALRRLISAAVDGKPPAPPAGASGHQVMVRFKDKERLALLRAAKERSTTPANWLRSLAIAHLARRPQWNREEAEALRQIGEELRRIGNNVNQIARALNVAAQTGEYPPHQGQAAKEAVEEVRTEMRRLMAAYTGNFLYWGVPDGQGSEALHGRLGVEQAEDGGGRARRRVRRRSPTAQEGRRPSEVG